MPKSLIEKEVGAELMLYDPDEDEVHILNPTAKTIYLGLKKGKTAEEIGREIRGRFLVGSDENLLDAVKKCIDDLREKGLIEAPGMNDLEGRGPGDQ